MVVTAGAAALSTRLIIDREQPVPTFFAWADRTFLSLRFVIAVVITCCLNFRAAFRAAGFRRKFRRLPIWAIPSQVIRRWVLHPLQHCFFVFLRRLSLVDVSDLSLEQVWRQAVGYFGDVGRSVACHSPVGSLFASIYFLRRSRLSSVDVSDL